MNYYQSQNGKQRYKINKLLYKAIGKYQIKIPRGALGIEFALFNRTEEMGMDNFGYLNSFFFFISIIL